MNSWGCRNRDEHDGLESESESGVGYAKPELFCSCWSERERERERRHCVLTSHRHRNGNRPAGIRTGVAQVDDGTATSELGVEQECERVRQAEHDRRQRGDLLELRSGISPVRPRQVRLSRRCPQSPNHLPRRLRRQSAFIPSSLNPHISLSLLMAAPSSPILCRTVSSS